MWCCELCGIPSASTLSMSDSIELLKGLMGASAARHRVIANNLANINTPGYKRQDVRFRDAFAKALSDNRSGALTDVDLEHYRDTSSPARPDGNNVSTQREMGRMAENSLLYEVSTRVLQAKYQGLRKAISGR
jgi:flagellar basal-body rod protein FlgB